MTSSASVHVLSIVGARPNFMKIAPIVRELAVYPDAFESTVVHTGQHYDSKMSDVFFDELGMAPPSINLNVGSGSHAQQTAAIMAAFEPVVLRARPDLVLVVGDVNSTLACALVSVKLGIRVAHVEAGLRSFDRGMPEEINRLLTDQISDLLFVSERSGMENLAREGIAPEKTHFVGNVMIDTLLAQLHRARGMNPHLKHRLVERDYVLLTLHRPSNVDNDESFEPLMCTLEKIARDARIVFPVHPRTRPALERSPAARRLIAADRLRLLEPLGYLEFLGLMDRSRAVLTDSGGVQEETTILGIPCLTLRDTTERPATIVDGTNILVGSKPERILEGWQRAMATTNPPRVPELWDGAAARRIVEILRGVENTPIGEATPSNAVPRTA